MTADFGTSGECTGSASCNEYHATTRATAGRSTSTSRAPQQRRCAGPPGVVEQEQASARLTLARRYELAGSQLPLLTEKGTIAVTYARR